MGDDAQAQLKQQGAVVSAAKSNDRTKVLGLLAEKPSLVDAEGGVFEGQVTPLMGASEHGHVGMVELLLERGASINLIDHCGYTALYYAATNDRADVVSVLLRAGADASIRSNNGWNALMTAASRGHSAVVRVLIEQGATKAIIDERNSQYGQTALWLACSAGRSTEVVEMLLRAGADYTLADDKGRTPLQVAREYDRQEFVKVLKWYIAEERLYVLCKARHLHQDKAMRERFPMTAPVPVYLRERVGAGGRRLPSVLLVDQWKSGALTRSRGKRWCGQVLSEEEEKECDGVVSFVVKELDPEMFVELVEGLQVR